MVASSLKSKEIALITLAGESVHTSIFPYVCAVPSILAQHDIVTVDSSAIAEDEHKLMSGAVERSHSPVVLHPNTHIKEVAVRSVAGGDKLFYVSPVHTDEMNGRRYAVESQKAQG